MGLFDFFLSEEKKISKHQRVVADQDSQPEDREASCLWLHENGSDKALFGLCSRFDLKLTQQLKDQKEKEFTYGLIAQHGDDAIKAVKAWLRQCKALAYPLRLFEDLTDEEQAIQMVYELLQRELDKDHFKPGRKKALLVWLHERRHPQAIEKATPFLKDFDENVRISAAEVIIGQVDDAGREPLQAVLANPEEESNRLLIRVAETFVARRWPVDEEELASLPDNFSIQNGRIVA